MKTPKDIIRTLYNNIEYKIEENVLYIFRTFA